MALKIVIFFLQHGSGWSETYWNNESDPIAFADNQRPEVAKPNSVLVQRAKLLSPNASIIHIRASLDGKFRQEWGVDYGLPGYVGLATRAFLGLPIAGAEPVLPPSIRVEVQSASVAAGNIFKRKNYLGGVPGDLMAADGSLNRANPNWIKIVDDFFKIGDDRPFVVRSRPFRDAAIPITSFTPSADGLSAIIQPNVLLAIGGTIGLVNVRGIRQPHGWNGIHRAVVIPNVLAPGTFSMQIGPRRKAGVTIPVWNQGDGGTVGATDPEYHNVTLTAVEALVKKSTGRPFGVPRGRRSQP